MSDEEPCSTAVSRRLALLAGVGLVSGCAAARPPVVPGEKPAVLAADETYVCLSVTLLQAAGYAGLRFYFAGSPQEPLPATAIGPATLQFTVNPPTKTGAWSGALLYKVKWGWFRLGGVDVMTKNAVFKMATKLAPNAVNYVGDFVVDSGLYDIKVSVRTSQQTIEQARAKFGEVLARYPLAQRILT